MISTRMIQDSKVMILGNIQKLNESANR